MIYSVTAYDQDINVTTCTNVTINTNFTAERFGEHAERLACSQLVWRRALARPKYDRGLVECGLRLALEARGLSSWRLRRYDSAEALWHAHTAWNPWDARIAKHAWHALPKWGANTMWVDWYPKDAWDAQALRDADAALFVEYVALRRGGQTPELLTRGIQCAYEYGLALAIPLPDDTLGWAMVEGPA